MRKCTSPHVFIIVDIFHIIFVSIRHGISHYCFDLNFLFNNKVSFYVFIDYLHFWHE